jgi:hypothetical protein
VALRRLSTSSIQTNGKSSKLWDQTTFQSGMFALATVSLTSSASSIVFSGIPADYTHLQLRALTKATGAGTVGLIRFNSDANGVYHQIIGNGSTATADRGTGNTDVGYFFVPDNSFAANTFGAVVMDILDYRVSGKNRVTRDLSGADNNGSGSVLFTSGLWINTAAVTSISIRTLGTSFAANSHFALYGIKAG